MPNFITLVEVDVLLFGEFLLARVLKDVNNKKRNKETTGKCLTLSILKRIH